MGRIFFRVFQVIVSVTAAVQITGCAFGPSSKPVSSGTGFSAASNATSGPLLGTWWDASHKSLRTVYGVIGAAHQGTASFGDGTYSGAATCMRKSLTMLTSATGSVYAVSLPDGSPVAIAGNANPRASIVFSPSCTASLVYSPGSASALLVQGLVSSPTVNAVTLSTGTIVAAVSDSGAVLTAVRGLNGAATIQLMASGAKSFEPVTALAGFGGMAFLPGVDSALLADAGSNVVAKMSAVSGNVSLTPIANAINGVSKPIAIGISGDGRLAAIANSDGASVLRLDLSGQTAPMQTVCRCAPTRLEPLAGNFAFRLNEPSAGTVWAFDGEGPQPRVLFLPSDQAASISQAGRL